MLPQSQNNRELPPITDGGYNAHARMNILYLILYYSKYVIIITIYYYYYYNNNTPMTCASRVNNYSFYGIFNSVQKNIYS